MNKAVGSSVVALLVLLPAGFAPAVENLIDSVANGCDKELATYCSEVTPGEGRVLACLYAHGDKLSARCEYALYDAAAQLDRAIEALTYLANECRADMREHCAGTEPGEGRLIMCLHDKRDKISERCVRAMDDIRLEVKQ